MSSTYESLHLGNVNNNSNNSNSNNNMYNQQPNNNGSLNNQAKNKKTKIQIWLDLLKKSTPPSPQQQQLNNSNINLNSSQQILLQQQSLSSQTSSPLTGSLNQQNQTPNNNSPNQSPSQSPSPQISQQRFFYYQQQQQLLQMQQSGNLFSKISINDDSNNISNNLNSNTVIDDNGYLHGATTTTTTNPLPHLINPVIHNLTSSSSSTSISSTSSHCNSSNSSSPNNTFSPIQSSDYSDHENKGSLSLVTSPQHQKLSNNGPTTNSQSMDGLSFFSITTETPPIPFPTITQQQINIFQQNNISKKLEKNKKKQEQLLQQQLMLQQNALKKSSSFTLKPDLSPTPEMKATKENFFKTVQDPKSLKNFKSYLESSQSMENLDFILEIERYRKIDNENELRFTCNEIWRRFFQQDCTTQLNVEAYYKKNLEDSKKNPTPYIFDDVQEQVLEDIVCDAYRHFLFSPFNQDWRVQNQQYKDQQPQSSSSNTPMNQNPSQSQLPSGSIANQGNSSSASNQSGQNPNSGKESNEDKFESSTMENIIDQVINKGFIYHNEIVYEDVSVTHWIASGASGRVYHGYWDEKEVAIKVFGNELNVYFELGEYKKEVTLMSILKHESLAKCFGAGTYNNCFFHVTEYCHNGSLNEYLRNPLNVIDPTTKLLFAFQIANGMKYLHSLSIIHRDLKSMNIMLTKKNKIKIIDFGSSRFVNKNMTSHVGTQAWMAPEIFTSKRYTEKVDVYSFGIILWEIFTRKAPYEHDKFNVPFLVTKGERPELPKDCPAQILNLIKKCWAQKPSHRPSFTKICIYLENIIQQQSISIPIPKKKII
ncbi:RGS domain-containing protein [Tieghemostelium lacteum]|uniref:RGS domain-containing protein n=1 Tax=Tieghemostelium lacteum TaxID=361077 RepID=A0A151ZGB1_TIELA|nr:RGS domain-containing protein [Tieghemostelium lacteum]|eukprot:KYQ93012.1 RGS domain-containing protein [Tieghemostelium lacteum]